MSRICVKNLGKTTNEKQLKDLFGTKGEVTDVRLVKTKSGKSRQLAFLGFRTEVQAQEAINYFNNTFLETTRITVESAKKIGDQTLIDSTRSKITKKKLEKAAKEQSVENQKAKNDARLAAKKASISKEPQSKEKRDFMEAMKPRRNTQFWANDESLPSTLAPNDEDGSGSVTVIKNDAEDDDDSDVDEEDMNDFSNSAIQNKAPEIPKKGKKEDKLSGGVDKASVPVPKVSQGISDMDYLRSKVKAHFSDDEASDIGDAMEEDSDEDSVEPIKATRGAKSSSAPSSGVKDTVDSSQTEPSSELPAGDKGVDEENGDDYEDSGRLFVRNLTFSCTEDEIKSIFGAFGPVTMVHLPLDAEKKSKGFGFVQFVIPEQAQKAREELDGSSFQGRLLHIINAKKAPEIVARDLDSGKTKLSSYQQKKEEDRRKMANRTEGWNSSFVRSDAVVDSLADR
jgi:multiple RNA-binding domain-containing protein 1